MGDTFADAAFECKRQEERLEDVLLGALWDFYERSGAWVKRLDYYDRSIEWWVKDGSELDELDRAVLWTLGFSRCWLCGSKDFANDVEETNDYERFYWADGDAVRATGGGGR